ncbi:hypothetical protein FXO38_10030 [Capsicum annuum]|nr:hypothetical protein FXO38_10030 [Capsicum annuum]
MFLWSGSTDRDYSRVSLAAAVRIVEADEFMRDDKYEGWFPHFFGENLRKGQTIGVIWAGPIGLAYARMMGFSRMAESMDLSLAAKMPFQSIVPRTITEGWLDGSFLKTSGVLGSECHTANPLCSADILANVEWSSK